MQRRTGTRWSQVLLGQVSETALRGLSVDLDLSQLRGFEWKELAPTRDERLRCDPEFLKRVLLERKLPIFESILDFEAYVGGASETIEMFENRVFGREPLTPENLPQFEGKVLLPIAPPNDPLREEIPHLEGIDDQWIAEDGTCFEQPLDLPGKPIEPFVESFRKHFEQWGRERAFAALPGLLGGAAVSPSIQVTQVAQYLGLHHEPQSSDRYTTVWVGNDLRLVARARDIFFTIRSVDGFRRLIDAVKNVAPGETLRWGQAWWMRPLEVDDEIVFEWLPEDGGPVEHGRHLVVVNGASGPYVCGRSRRQ